MKEWISNQSGIVIVLAALFIIAFALSFPLMVIWALNTLFNLGIAYGVAEYFAIVVLNIWTLRFKTKKD